MISRSTLLACLLLGLAAPARARILQNDSAAPGEQVAFYNNLQGGESFGVFLDAPADLDRYQICGLRVWIGPDDFNVFTVRIMEAANLERGALLWHSGLDAYQIFGSREALSRVDLVDERIFTRSRQLWVLFTHVEAFNGPPTIVSDSDGITPGRNFLSVFLRNGSWLDAFTDELEEGGAPDRPPGDWVLRAEVIGEDDVCPNPDDVITPDGGILQAPDVGPDQVPDGGLATGPDGASPPDDGADGSGPSPADGSGPPPPPLDLGAGLDTGGGRLDAGRADTGDRTPPGAFRLDSVVPAEGPTDRNTDVVMKGQGFPFGEAVEAFIGEERMLEVEVLSTSTITAIVPAGLEAGIYSIRIDRADGQSEVLPQAFTILGGDQSLDAGIDAGADGGGRAAAEGCCRVSDSGAGAPWLLLLLLSRALRRRRRA